MTCRVCRRSYSPRQHKYLCSPRSCNQPSGQQVKKHRYCSASLLQATLPCGQAKIQLFFLISWMLVLVVSCICTCMCICKYVNSSFISQGCWHLMLFCFLLVCMYVYMYVCTYAAACTPRMLVIEISYLFDPHGKSHIFRTSPYYFHSSCQAFLSLIA